MKRPYIEPCAHCTEDHSDSCHYCGDELCESHSFALPRYPVLRACSDCFEKRFGLVAAMDRFINAAEAYAADCKKISARLAEVFHLEVA